MRRFGYLESRRKSSGSDSKPVKSIFLVLPGSEFLTAGNVVGSEGMGCVGWAVCSFGGSFAWVSLCCLKHAIEQLGAVSMRHILLTIKHLLWQLASWTLVLGLALFTHATDTYHLEIGMSTLRWKDDGQRDKIWMSKLCGQTLHLREYHHCALNIPLYIFPSNPSWNQYRYSAAVSRAQD